MSRSTQRDILVIANQPPLFPLYKRTLSPPTYETKNKFSSSIPLVFNPQPEEMENNNNNNNVVDLTLVSFAQDPIQNLDKDVQTRDPEQVQLHGEIKSSHSPTPGGCPLTNSERGPTTTPLDNQQPAAPPSVPPSDDFLMDDIEALALPAQKRRKVTEIVDFFNLSPPSSPGSTVRLEDPPRSIANKETLPLFPVEAPYFPLAPENASLCGRVEKSSPFEVHNEGSSSDSSAAWDPATALPENWMVGLPQHHRQFNQ
ncbi:hypothetical protein JRO89_XS08G0107700 [Xanthoceras sorbifolium]|uniref:Uncharacterized protein n=1 Tax=Xanthoceras sorbifolium TaxID=99658 RepID=A0ABQ8HPI1_9ROSI|nr:hypothetical protein JRO89_XS08G0107700 [Xanthoceras sorbifolium]